MVKDKGTTTPEEQEESNMWEAIADIANRGDLPFMEKLRMIRKLREAKASPEVQDMMQRIRDASAGTIEEING